VIRFTTIGIFYQISFISTIFILRPYQFCNLSTIVVRPEDTKDTIRSKVVIATIMGTMQATLTDFPYLRPIWRKNTEAERLLGVSMTGPFSNPIVFDTEFQQELRDYSRSINIQWAGILGINPSAAGTCIKPEGTVSQLTLSEGSGLHPGHAPFYTRRVRQDNKDPLTQFLIQQGVPYEPCVMKPDSTTVFSFPMRCKGLTRKDITALQHLNIWLDFQRN